MGNMGKGDISIWEKISHNKYVHVMDKRNNAYLENNFNTASFAKLTQQL